MPAGNFQKANRQSHKKHADIVKDKLKIVELIQSGAHNIDIVRKSNCPESIV